MMNAHQAAGPARNGLTAWHAAPARAVEARQPLSRTPRLALAWLVLVPWAGLAALPVPAQAHSRDAAVVARLAAIERLTPAAIARQSPRIQSALGELSIAAAQIGDPTLRTAIAGLLADPAPTFLGVHSRQLAFDCAAGGGWTGHHAYPGGLAVHTMVNLRHAMAMLAIYQSVYGITLDRDLVTAAVLGHDALKAWTNQFWPRWNEQNGHFFVPPDVAPGARYGAWGVHGLMGHHNTLIAAELMHRRAPAPLVFATIAHVDQALDDREHGSRRASDETWERTFEQAMSWLEARHPGEAGSYRAAYQNGHWKRFEAGVNFLADTDWNLTEGQAAPLARQAFDAFAATYGLAPDSRAYGLARDWAYAQLDPMRIAYTAQRQGLPAATALVTSAFQTAGPKAGARPAE